ncbi:MAG: radical SAM family heme chaperone HemW [Clostridia bacterium]|nr:radical SAM family heme chaperone HemW [Clostridia bacterium]
MKKNISLYIHIPFCKSKCLYCGFCSFCDKGEYVLKYIQKVKQELALYEKILKDRTIQTIYIGGGTPSIVDAFLIKDMLSFIYDNFNVEKNAEISIEANPDSITQEKAIMWKESKINRVSVGLQSNKNETLKFLKRPHTFDDYLKAIKSLKQAGFKNINTDILLGLLNQTEDDIKSLIKILAELNLTHISAYGLMVEEGTALFDFVKSKKIILPSEEISVNLYNTASKELKKYGYNRYEISNFSKPNFECKHNLNYWQRGEFLGVGLSSYSFLLGEHFENTHNFFEYLNSGFKRLNIEKETPKTAMEEVIMLSLRLESGLDIIAFNKMFNVNFLEKFDTQIKKLLSNNLIEIKDNHLKIVDFEVSNMIISEFF